MPPRPPDRTPQSRLRIGLGTWIAVEARARRSGQAASAIETAFQAIGEIENRLHPSRRGSDLARINAASERGARSRRSRGVGSITVHPTTWCLLQFAKRLFALSNGAFDPCLPSRPGRLSDIELEKGRRVLCHAPVQLDFGGFAKGYAIDCAIAVLIRQGCISGLVNAGGDLRVFGNRSQTILLREPSGLLRPLELRWQALAVSHLKMHDRPREHQGYYLRETRPQSAARRLGQRLPSEAARSEDPDGPLNAERSASVVAREAVAADALTKCVLLCAPEIARRALHELGGIDIGRQSPTSTAVIGLRASAISPSPGSSPGPGAGWR